MSAQSSDKNTENGSTHSQTYMSDPYDELLNQDFFNRPEKGAFVSKGCPERILSLDTAASRLLGMRVGIVWFFSKPPFIEMSPENLIPHSGWVT